MKLLCVLLVLISASLALGMYIPFDVCGEPVFIPDTVSIAPSPVKIGGRLLVRIRGTADRQVTGGSFKYEISYRFKNPFKTFYVTIDEATEDLCHRAACPITPGHVMFEYRKSLPPVLAPGLYRIKIEATTSTGESLLCLVIHLDFVTSSQNEEPALIPQWTTRRLVQLE